jgi:amino acid adenylation domain-containing protein
MVISINEFNLSEKRLALPEMLVLQKELDAPFGPAISPRDLKKSVPLSFSQQRLWFLEQLDPGSTAYNLPLAIRLSGHLNVAALEQSLGEIIRRHEVLRTTFSTENNQTVQRITPAAGFNLPEVDLSAMPQEQREAKAKRLASEEASRPFDLVIGPLLRVMLLKLSPEDHVLLLTIHHIVSDGWSLGILYREISVLYEAYLKGKLSPLSELPIQYADFAVWQREWLKGKNLEEQLIFWKKQLSDITNLELPTDHPRPSMQTFHGATHNVEFPHDVTEALKDLSRMEGTTLFMTLLAAFQCLLHRYTCQDDIVVGTPIANRNRAEIEGLIGFFVNTLVMRTDTSGDPVFLELLQRVRRVTLDAFAHQDLPFEKLVEELHLERDLSRSPLFQVMFALQNELHSTLYPPGLTQSRMEIEDMKTLFDLEFYLWETTEGLRGALEYNTDLFDAVTIERMAGHYQMMLEGIAANPDLRLSELPLLTETERQQILVEWNIDATDYPRDKCIHELFEEQVERTPDAVALIFEDKQLTYREVNNRANQLAHYLRKQGVGPEVFVGICEERSPELIVGLLGILKAGGAYVSLDPEYPQERLNLMLDDAGISVLLTHKRLSTLMPFYKGKLVGLDTDWKDISRESRGNPVARATPDNAVCLFYTSGSTGRPKGAIIQHRSLVHFTMSVIAQYGIKASDRILQFSSTSFDASAEEIYPCLALGATLVLRTNDMLTASDFLKKCDNWKLTVLSLPTAYWHVLTYSIETEDLKLPSSVRLIIIGGERARPECLTQWQRHVGPRVKLLNTYGPTEATVVATLFDLTHFTHVADWAKEVPIGRPLPGVRTYILDPHLQPVPIGVPGELHIGGSGIVRGYLNRPDVTSEKFIQDRFSNKPGDKMYKTGDLARYLSDGNIEFLGRIDNQVKIRGFRIEPGEIEALLGQHPHVQEAVVIAREDQNGNRCLVAYVVPDRKSAIATQELRKFLKEKLSDYMVPSAFITLDVLPMTPNGKVDRKALPTPDYFTSASAKTFLAPRNTIESQLTSIWEQVLGIQAIGVTDNFFELGGHSLLAVRVVSEIRKITGRKLPVMAIFQFPTIEQLALLLTKEGWTSPWSSLWPIQPSGTKTPFFWVHGQASDALLPSFLGSDQPLYGLMHQGLDGKTVSYTSIEEIAAKYLQEIRTVQPIGPYLLGGYCFGGLVAMEMAQQLFREGEKVSLMFVIELPAVCFPLTSQDASPLPQKEKLTERLARHFDHISRLDPLEKTAYILRKTTSLLPRIKARNERRIKKAILSKIYLAIRRPLPEELRIFHLMNVYSDAMDAYEAPTYPGHLVLCQAEQMPCNSRSDWNVAATEGVEIHIVTGAGHANILEEPYIESWAKLLNRHLNEIQGGG